MNILDKIVKDMLEKHTGGETFFDHVDEAVRDNELIIEAIINLISKNDHYRYPIIVSGKFGVLLNNFNVMKRLNYDIICVNGSLRKGQPITDLSYLAQDFKGRQFIFLDDSFYSGKTLQAVQDELCKLGAKIKYSCVAYDGSLHKRSDVRSLYRYYE